MLSDKERLKIIHELDANNNLVSQTLEKAEKACEKSYDLLYKNYEKYRQDHREKCISKSVILNLIKKKAYVLGGSRPVEVIKVSDLKELLKEGKP